MTIDVRVVRPEEYEVAGEVAAGAYREFVRDDSDWSEYIERIADVAERATRTTVLVAADGDRIVGTVTLELDGRIEAEDGSLAPDEAEIRMLGVDPDARGRGVGRLLMQSCEARALAARRTIVRLHTTERMRVAQRMYEEMGYERGEDRVFPDGFVLWSYSKRLA